MYRIASDSDRHRCRLSAKAPRADGELESMEWRKILIFESPHTVGAPTRGESDPCLRRVLPFWLHSLPCHFPAQSISSPPDLLAGSGGPLAAAHLEQSIACSVMAGALTAPSQPLASCCICKAQVQNQVQKSDQQGEHQGTGRVCLPPLWTVPLQRPEASRCTYQGGE